MHTPSPNRNIVRRRGSAIIAVVIIATVFSLVFASAIAYTMTEARLNRQAEALLIAKHVSEAAGEMGFAQLSARFNTSRAFPNNDLSPNNNPLVLSSAFNQMFSRGTQGPSTGLKLSITHPDSLSPWGPTEVLIPPGGFNSSKPWGSQSVELIGGVIETTGLQFIDPRVPGNEFDPLAGSLVFARQVRIYSKGTVRSAIGREVTSYMSQQLQVRDAPLFANAIFYNGIELEIAPGPQMDIYGPVHANSNIFLKGNSRLNFHEKLTTSQNIYHGRSPYYQNDTNGGTIYVKDATDTLVRMNSGQNSNMSNWREFSAQRWDGRVLTHAHGVGEQQPVGIESFVHDSDLSTAIWEPLNYGYNIIQPVLNSAVLTSGTPEVNARRQAIEEEKFSFKAGLTLEYDGANVQIFTYQRDAEERIVYDAGGQPVRIPLTVNPGDEFWSVNTSGSLTDKREGRAPDVIEIDVEQLRKILDDNQATDWGAGAEDPSAPEKPANWWNGVVYIQTPLKGGLPARADWVTPADENVAVRLNKGSVIPNPAFAVAKSIYGTTFATNTYLYVNGSFNSDGNLGTGSPTEPDNDAAFGTPNHEAPAALVADAVMVLSESWSDSNSHKALSNRTASNTEISAAILTGQVPSGYWGYKHYSGGVENFPRFLENWSGRRLQYRGSMVALFSSEVAKERWGKSDVYTPPARDWGFHTKFGEGFYPPGTPNTRTYRRINYRDLNAEEYQTELKELADLWGIPTIF